MATENAPTETERAVLNSFCEALAELTNISAAEVPREVLADALLSGAAEILRKLYSANVAAERLRQAAEIIELTNAKETSH